MQSNNCTIRFTIEAKIAPAQVLQLQLHTCPVLSPLSIIHYAHHLDMHVYVQYMFLLVRMRVAFTHSFPICFTFSIEMHWTRHLLRMPCHPVLLPSPPLLLSSPSFSRIEPQLCFKTITITIRLTLTVAPTMTK